MSFLSRFFIFLLFLLFFSFLFASLAVSQVYKWTDENGNIHFTDNPPAGAKAKKILEDRMDSKGQSNGGSASGSRMARKRDYRGIKVTIYTTSWSPYCQRAKEYLDSLKVTYTEYDIEKDEDKAAEFRSKGGKGVPLFDIEGIIIKGYSPTSVRSALDSKSKPQ